MSQNELQARFTLSQEEFSRAHRHHLRRSFLTAKNFILISFALMIAGLQAQVLGPTGWASSLFLGIWVAVIAWSIYAYWKLPMHLYRRDPRHGMEHVLTANRSGLALESGGKKYFSAWDQIVRTAENSEFWFIYASSPLPTLIPKRAFESWESQEAFRAYVAERLTESTTTGTVQR